MGSLLGVLLVVSYLAGGIYTTYNALFKIPLSGNGEPPPEWGAYSAWLYRAVLAGGWAKAVALGVNFLLWPLTLALFEHEE
jgi:hypothetical protein